jgi:5-methylcytosine-specific restriction endonuclease McrA
VNNPTYGAKANWHDGVYAGPTLKTGKEKWCAGCHDDQPAYSMAETVTPIIMDDPDATYVCSWPWRYQEGGYYGAGYRYHAAGTGSCTATWIPTIPRVSYYKVYAWWQAQTSRASNAPYTINYDGGSETVLVNQQHDSDQWNYLGIWPFTAGTSGSVVLSDDADNNVIADAIKLDGPGTYAPNVIGDNTTYGFYVTGHKISCTNCHDASKKHIDHKHRTYEADENTHEAINPYCDSYRLKDIDGQPCMNIPRPLRGSGANPLNAWRDFALCFSCHNKYEVLSQTGAPDATNYWNDDSSPANSHNIHLGISSYHFDSDWDSGHGTYGSERNDSSESCTACHNVHGSPSRVMIRHGELISSYGSTDKSPSLNFAYLVPYTPSYATATWTPNLAGGNYDVYAWWVVSSNRATNAKYTVYYNGGSATVTKNQQINGSQWNLLGNYNFSAGTSGYVMLSNEGADGYVIADAVGWDSDFDGTPDVIIDNGDPEFAFVGDCVGNWTCPSGIADAYGSDYCYHAKPSPCVDSNASLEQSVGGQFSFGGAQTNMNGVCRACHSAVSYVRTPTYINPRVLMSQTEPSSVDNNGTDTVILTAYVYSPDDTISSVTIDLSPIDGSATQTMYDDGTNGDAVAGDKIYSYLTTVPGTVDTGLKTLTVTGTDSQSRTGSEDIKLMVANPNWTVVDNWDADFIGYWASSTSGDLYNRNLKYHASGTGSDTSTFTPVLSQSGNYNVYAWWTSSSNRATNAPYTINHSGGSDTVRVNQRINGSQFFYLGTYNFNAQTGYTSVIVDNVSAVFAGTWSSSLNGEYYGTDIRYIQSTGTGSNTATFIPNLPQTGNYNIYAWWTSSSNRATNVPYIINYSGGASDTVRVNQELGGGGWTYLGTYYFDAGTSGYVEISDDAELNEYVMADAIKWQLSSTQQGVVLSDDADGYVIADAILFEPAD